MLKSWKRYLAALLMLALLVSVAPVVYAATPDAAIAANAQKDLRYLALDDENNGPHDLYYQQKIMNPVVEDAFVLWYEGKNTKYSISWASSNPGLLRINDVTHMAELTAIPAEDTEVTLTATMAVPYTSGSKDTYPMEKQLVVKIPCKATRLQMDYDALTITNPDDVRENLPLLKKGKYGSDIAWSSSDPAVISDESAASALYDGGVVTRPPYGGKAAAVTVTATLRCDGKTLTKSFPVTVSPLPAPAQAYDHYLFACYAENYDWNQDNLTTEEIYFGLSDNGLQWKNINVYKAPNGKEYTRPILRSTVGDMGTRDPHILRSHAGDKFYVLATDLHAIGNPLPEREGAEFKSSSFDCVNGNRDLVIWETNDLSDWGEPRLVKCNFASSGDTYAPEAIWDADAEAYLVYWASKDNAELNADGTYKASKVGKIYYCYTRDFYTFSEPTLWLSSTDSAMKSAFPSETKEYDIYDTTISYDSYDGLYYRFGTKNKLYVQTSQSLSGPWSDAQALPGAINSGWGVEAPTAYQLADGSWMLLGDNYRQYVPYKAAHLADFVSGSYQSLSFEYASNGPRYKHGTILPITEAEYSLLMTAYDDSIQPQQAPAAGEGYRLDFVAETLTVDSGYEVCTSQSGGAAIFGGIADYIGQTLYIRKPAKEGYKASDWTALPIPARPAAPTGAITAEKSASSVTITNAAAFAGCEFACGGAFGDNTTFADLEASTEYTLSIRTKASTAAFASESAKRTVTLCAANGATTLLPGEIIRVGEATVYSLGAAVTVTRGDSVTLITPPAAGAMEYHDGMLVLLSGSVVKLDADEIALPDGGSFYPATGTLMKSAYVVSFDAQGGSAVESVTVANGYQLQKPADPTRDGYRFGGWFKDAECTQEWNFSADPVESEWTLYAMWTPVKIDNPFTDVTEGAYYFDAVLWAIGSDITAGVSATSFAPERSCTRAQMVTFLWRAAGCPEPTELSCPFTDILPGAYYEKAVLWAVEKKITNGAAANRFGTEDTVTRAQAVTFLWRAAGQPVPAGQADFADVAPTAYYAQAVAWAAENNITRGTSATTFSPENACVRGQIVTFLYRSKK